MQSNWARNLSVPAEFHQIADELRRIVLILNDYLRDTDVDVPDSLAASEFKQEATHFSDAYISDPVLHVLVRAQHGLIAAIDHVLGLAACVEAERVVFASFSLLRPAVVGAGVCYYLLDPHISLRERLRRGWNFELESVREQLNGIDKHQDRDAWLDVAQARYRYLAWGAKHGYGRMSRKDRFGETRYWLVEADATNAPPSEIRIASDVLGAIGDGSVGRSMYKFTSAFIHMQTHAFSVLLQAPMYRDPQIPSAIPLGVSQDHFMTWTTAMVMALDTSARRCGAYFGWELDRWEAEVLRTLTRWTEMLRQADRPTYGGRSYNP